MAADTSYSFNMASITLYAIEGIYMVLPLRNSIHLTSPTLSFNQIYYTSFCFTFILYGVFGIANALKFGNQTKELIFYNYTSKDRIIFSCEIAYTVVLFCSNCMNLFPVYTSLYDIPVFSRLIYKHVW